MTTTTHITPIDSRFSSPEEQAAKILNVRISSNLFEYHDYDETGRCTLSVFQIKGSSDILVVSSNKTHLDAAIGDGELFKDYLGGPFTEQEVSSLIAGGTGYHVITKPSELALIVRVDQETQNYRNLLMAGKISS